MEIKVSDTRPNSLFCTPDKSVWLGFRFQLWYEKTNEEFMLSVLKKALQFHTEWLLCRSEFAAHFSNNRPNWSASLEKMDYFLLCWIPTVIFLVCLLPLCLCPQRLCFLLCASPFEMVTFSFSGLCSLMLLCLLLESCYNHIYNHRIMCWDV